MQDACKYHYRECGLVLIEVMIAISIGLLLISLLMEAYLTCQKNVSLETALNTIQDNAKTLNFIFQSEISKGGNIGCARLTQDFPLISRGEYVINAGNKIMSHKANQITIRYAEYPNNILQKATNTDNRIHINKTARIKSGDILLISDCKKAEIAIAADVKNIHGNLEITLTAPLHYHYERFAEVSLYLSNTFYTRDHSLFLEDIHHRKSIIISGIDHLQIRYTIKNGDAMRDVSWNEVSDWENILGVAMEYQLTSGSLKKNWYFYSKC